MPQSQESHRPDGAPRWEKPDLEKRRMEDAYERYASLLREKIASFVPGRPNYWLNHDKVSWPKPLYKGSYNGMNALMLMMHCDKEGFKVPVFVSRERLMDLNYQRGPDGRSVPATDGEGRQLPFVHLSKGARSFPVFLSQATITSKATREEISYRQYMSLPKEAQNGYNVRYSPVVENVFNVDQTNIPEARPDLYQRLIDENQPRLLENDDRKFHFAPLDVLIGNHFWICDFYPSYDGDIFYDVRANRINFSLKDAFQGGNGYYGTVFEKMVVSALAGEAVRPELDDGRASSEYVRRELAAELGSALVCQRYGIRKQLEPESLDFCDRWARNLKEIPEYGPSVLRNVKDATGRMSVLIDCAQKVYLEKHQGDDLREDGQSEGMDVNGDGVVDAGDTHYSADRKQGSGEGEGETEEEAQKKRPAFHR